MRVGATANFLSENSIEILSLRCSVAALDWIGGLISISYIRGARLHIYQGSIKAFQEWSFSVQGGITFAEPVGRAFPSGTLQVTTSPERDTVVRLGIT